MDLINMQWDTKPQKKTSEKKLQFFFSILCLTTDPIHQGHEKIKEIRDVITFPAQHVRAATRSIKCERQ